MQGLLTILAVIALEEGCIMEASLERRASNKCGTITCRWTAEQWYNYSHIGSAEEPCY